MGSSVTAHCQCGLQETVDVGGGMETFEAVCFFPCLCGKCRSVVQVNLLKRRLRCPNCRSGKVIPYDDPQVLGEAGQNVVAGWDVSDVLGRELELTDGKYRCPKCGKMSLRFEDAGVCWD